MMHTPYGYRIVDAKAVVDEEAAKSLRALYNEFLACGSMRAAAQKSGIEKTHSVIGRLLKNEVYLGTEYYPQIIEEETFEKVQELRGNNAKSQNRLGARKQPKPVELKKYRIGRIDKKYENPYLQAEYAYSLIEEDGNE